MPLTRSEKSELIAHVSDVIERSQSIVVAEYRGLSVKQMTSLRVTARAQGVVLHVLKNTLVSRSLSGTSFSGIQANLTGPLLYAFSADPVAASKVLVDFSKQNEKLVIKVGALPGVIMGVSEINVLASLPTKEILLSRFVGTLQLPISIFARTLSQVPSGFVRVLAAVRDSRN